ncbi:hypothetical protein HMN09_00203400 [Mycena chlorophos]|uniref:Peptidase C14 caspase domain-containing protein n=1 Tax=Mycena chlorophos TaxID=658473 RepID=A0A8H6WNE0_MYCCL|nr:hypothetical protein HMN09_00203400 [Mycena chlorophos]
MGPRPNLFALLIGVDEYAHPAIQNLGGCVKDVHGLQEALSFRYPKASFCILNNQDATRAGILDAFRTHLCENPRISPNDAMLVYFAGYGQRYKAHGREVDALIPADYGEDVPGIFDANLHGLLQEIVEKKGSNMTLILDCCFAQSRSVTAVRRIVDPSWPAHLTTSYKQAALPDYHGLFTNAQRYVFLGASPKYGHCKHSPNGGLFTQALISSLKSAWPLSCRELTVLTQRALEPEGVMPVGFGQHLDRILFALPQLRPIEKLRVFLSKVEPKSLDDSCVVSRKQLADIAVHGDDEGRALIERLKTPIFPHGRAQIVVTTPDLPQILSAVARFHYFLGLRPTPATGSWLQRFWSRLRRLLGRGVHSSPPSLVEMYHYEEERPRQAVGEISQNILQDGVARLADVPNDHVFGLKITNWSDKPMYPYLVHFDSSTYEVKVLHSPFPKDAKSPPRPISPHSALVFGHVPDQHQSWETRPALRVNPDDSPERTAEILKVILSEKPISVEYMEQGSPMLVPRERDSDSESPGSMHEAIPGIWTTETVVVAVPKDYYEGAESF